MRLPSSRPRGMLSSMRLRLLLTAILTLAVSGLGHAQRPRHLCFRGGPASRCHRFLITETGLFLSPSSGYRRPGANFVWEVGGMVNGGAGRAYGGSVFVVTDDEDRWMFGVRPRVRFRLSQLIGLDVAPGVLVGGRELGFYAPRFPAFSGYAGVTLADWLAAGIQLEILPINTAAGRTTETRVYGGVRLGSYAGLVTGPPLAAFIHWIRSID